MGGYRRACKRRRRQPPRSGSSPDKTVFDIDVKQWSDVLNLNLAGTLLPTLSFGEYFKKSKTGAIVNFSSMTAQSVVTRVLGYSNAKAGIDNLTKWLAVEFAKKIGEGVRVNAVAPGFFISSQNRTLLTNPDDSLTERGKDIDPQNSVREVRRAGRSIWGSTLPVLRRVEIHHGNSACNRRRVLVLLGRLAL